MDRVGNRTRWQLRPLLINSLEIQIKHVSLVETLMEGNNSLAWFSTCLLQAVRLNKSLSV